MMKLLKVLVKRIAKIVGIPLENAEAFQIIYYGITQKNIEQHYDSWIHDNSVKTHRCMKFGWSQNKNCFMLSK